MSGVARSPSFSPTSANLPDEWRAVKALVEARTELINRFQAMLVAQRHWLLAKKLRSHLRRATR